MPVFQGEKVEQQQEGRRVFRGEPVQQQRPQTPELTADRGVRQSTDFIAGGGPLGLGQKVNLTQEQSRREGTTTMGAVKGFGDAALSTASSVLAEPIAGLSGLWEMGATSLIRDPSSDPLERGVAKIEAVRDALTYQPRTREGQDIARLLSEDPAIQSLLQTAQSGGGATLEATGSPAAATGVQTFIEFLPGMLSPQSRFNVRGVRGEGFAPESPSELAPGSQTGPEIQELPATPKARKRDIKRVDNALKGEGINVSSKEGLMRTIQRVGERVQQPGFASSLESVRNAILQAKGVEKATENRLWENARQGTPAAVRREEAVQFEAQLDEALDGFVMEEMGSLNKLVRDLKEGVANAPENSAIKLRALMDWRKALNRNMPSKSSPEQKAFVIAKRNLDNFLQTQFATDMIKGDPESLARWQAAIGKSAEFREMFEDNKIIRQLAEHDADPEQLRNLIFNASSVGAKATSAGTVKRIKRILGEDSQEIVALRQESLYNLMEPILSENPDFRRFRANYEKFVKKNPRLVNELFTENSRDRLQALYSASKSAQARQTLQQRFGRDWREIPAVALFGHGIAQAGLKVRLAKDITNNIMSVDNSNIRREIMRDFLGYDPNKALFSSPAKKAIAIEGVIQSQKEEQE